MRNRSIMLFLMLFLAVSSAGCSRCSVEEVDDEEVNAGQVDAAGERKTDVDVMPVENLPDVKIDTSAEIPSDKDITNVKVPDVEIDATKGMDDIDETRVDGMDDVVDEP